MNRLKAVSFFSGAALMILELSGSRFAAPFFGTSLIVWTALIGVIMASLCAGSWLGGVWADRRPDSRTLGNILLSASVVTAVTSYAGNFLMSWIYGLNMNVYLGSVVIAVILFLPASMLLGMVQPFTVRLAMKDVKSSGTLIGRLSALNSAGSITGTFAAGFVLTALLPSGIILMLLSGGIALLSVLVSRVKWRNACVSAVIFAAAFMAYRYGFPAEIVGTHIETQYNHIRLVDGIEADSRRLVRLMFIDPEHPLAEVYLDNTLELKPYFGLQMLAMLHTPEVKKVLVLGGGAYVVPRYILSEMPDVSVDVVEIDPGITEAAKKYFFLKDSPRLRIFDEDARTFLNRAEAGQYDCILVDTYGTWTAPPFQMTTSEAAGHIRRILKPGGSVGLNVISSVYGRKSGILHGIYKAFAQHFGSDNMMLFPVFNDAKYYEVMQNVIVVISTDGKLGIQNNIKFPGMDELLEHKLSEPFVPDGDVPVFTDSFAPVEKYAVEHYND